MTREHTINLAKYSWMFLLVYLLGNRFVGLVIGRAVADMLVFVFAVIGLCVAVYCLASIRRHGGRGIFRHAVGTLVVASIIMAIWIPNALAARDRARARAQNGPVLSVHVARDGTILMNGVAAPVDRVEDEVKRAAAAKGVLRYSRDDPGDDPHPNAMRVLKAAADSEMAIEMAVSALP